MDVERVVATTMSRRRLLAVGGASVLAGMAASLLPRMAGAQGATDETQGYPQLNITVEEKAIKVPERVSAGLTFATIKNASKNDNLVLVMGQLPDGVSRDALTSALAGFNEAKPETLAPLAAILSKMALVGGPGGPAPGQTESGIVRLTEGTYAVISVFGNQAEFFEVGPVPADAKTAEPAADVTVKLGNMVFVGLDQGVPAGKHLWKVENIDTMEHDLILVSVKPGTTADDIKKQLMQDAGNGGDGGDNAAQQNGGDQPVDESGFSGSAAILSSGLASWQYFDLKPGHYAAFCMVPMNWSGPPHAMMGMIKIFEAK